VVEFLIMSIQRETLITVILITLCLGFTGASLVPKLLAQKSTVSATQPDIMVSISGEIKKPGTYTLVWGSRVQDIIQAAGGLTSNADPHLVNLAEPLDTGESVFIPSQMTEQGETRISINNATAKDLESLPSVGPATAQRILEGRPYNTLEDLLESKALVRKPSRNCVRLLR
jgi:DNA uptake protein ComE-like DNA-binding protein